MLGNFKKINIYSSQNIYQLCGLWAQYEVSPSKDSHIQHMERRLPFFRVVSSTMLDLVTVQFLEANASGCCAQLPLKITSKFFTD